MRGWARVAAAMAVAITFCASGTLSAFAGARRLERPRFSTSILARVRARPLSGRKRACAACRLPSHPGGRCGALAQPRQALVGGSGGTNIYPPFNPLLRLLLIAPAHWTSLFSHDGPGG